MSRYLFLILGYSLIFFSIVFLYFRLKKISLTKEDKSFWKKIERKFNFVKDKFLKVIKISEREIIFIGRNFLEKILLRIKIEALKIETWANKKLEKLKRNYENLDEN